jgi:hypothetical protein
MATAFLRGTFAAAEADLDYLLDPGTVSPLLIARHDDLLVERVACGGIRASRYNNGVRRPRRPARPAARSGSFAEIPAGTAMVISAGLSDMSCWQRRCIRSATTRRGLKTSALAQPCWSMAGPRRCHGSTGGPTGALAQGTAGLVGLMGLPGP